MPGLKVSVRFFFLGGMIQELGVSVRLMVAAVVVVVLGAVEAPVAQCHSVGLFL